MQHCVVSQNTSANDGGAISLEGASSGVELISTVVNQNQSTNGGGGGISITGEETFFYAIYCSFSQNMAPNAGFMKIDCDALCNIAFVNSTICKNIIYRDPASCCIGNITASGAGMKGTEITLVNVTMVENLVGLGNCCGDGAGWVFNDPGYTFHVYNSVIVGNVSPNYADVSCVAEPAEFIIKNSVVGWVHNPQDNGAPYVIRDNPAISAKSVVHRSYDEYKETDLIGGSGIYMEEAAFKTKRGYYYYTFYDNALGTRLGDPYLLSEWDSTKDLFLNERLISQGTIWAGAYQGVTEKDEAEDPNIPRDYLSPAYTTCNNTIESVFSGKDYSVQLTENHIQILSSTNESVQVTLYDLLGKNHYDRFFPTRHNIQIPISSFSQGVYLLKISTEDKKQFQTIKIAL